MMDKKNKVSGRFTGCVKFIFFVYVASIIFGTLIRIPLVSDDTENISLANGYTISAYKRTYSRHDTYYTTLHNNFHRKFLVRHIIKNIWDNYVKTYGKNIHKLI